MGTKRASAPKGTCRVVEFDSSIDRNQAPEDPEDKKSFFVYQIKTQAIVPVSSTRWRRTCCSSSAPTPSAVSRRRCGGASCAPPSSSHVTPSAAASFSRRVSANRSVPFPPEVLTGTFNRKFHRKCLGLGLVASSGLQRG